ncbi:MAG: ribF [Acidimicrobiaceae bacterium]|nr:MAG: ribF [Acidimicrobiaceae bacterium]
MHLITDLSASPWPPAADGRAQRSVVTIGAYDGVHLGHQAIIEEVRRVAAGLQARSVVITFDRHPASIVRPESAPQQLTDLEQKLELLDATGIDATVLVHFDAEQSHESPRSFVERVLVTCLAARRIVVGDDFHFGSHREGNAIRRALAGGEVELAARMLGRPCQARGVVMRGDQRGRLLGFPTANVQVPSSVCLPADGVYAGWYIRPDGVRHPCAINLGRRPTFYEHADHSILEAHLLDFSDDLYGEPARVEFTHFLRSERKFDGIEALRGQLQHDIDHARSMLVA